MEKSYLNRSYLDRQANQIERVLETISLPARVHGGQVTDRWVRYRLEPAEETQVSQVKQAAETVADAIGARGIRVAERVDGIAIEVPRMQRKALNLLPLMHAIHDLAVLNAVIGMQTSGKPLILDMTKPSTWHLFAMGDAGCGKSELLRTILASLCMTSRRSQLNMLGIDIGGRELGLIEALPHVLTDLATERDFAYEIILWLAQEIQRRLRIGVSRPHLILFIDDLSGLRAERSKRVHTALNEIVLKGFDTGVHLIGASNEPGILPMYSAQRRGGLVTASPIKKTAEDKLGRFQLKAGTVSRIVDVAYLSARDLDTVVQLVNSGWKSMRLPSGLGIEDRS